MAGHISEKAWVQVSDEVNRKLELLMQTLTESEALYQELLQLWTFHSGNSQSVADQLFYYVNEGGTATSIQVQMVDDVKDAMAAVHTIFTTGDLAAIRKMT